MTLCRQAQLVPGGGIRLVDAPHPGDPGRGEVLVAMLRAPINPADRLMIAGRYGAQPSETAVAGAEGVGRIVALGADVEGWAVGDRIMPLSRGNWTGLRRLPIAALLRVPDALPLDQAAMLRINPATAWRLLALGALRPGDMVIQNGGRSAVAMLIERIAAARGIGVLSVSRHADAVEPLVADGPDLAERVRMRAAGRPIRLALDCVAGEATGRLAACLDAGGRLIVFGHLSGEPCSLPSPLLTGRGLTVSGFSLRPAEAGDSIAALRALYAELAQLLIDAPLPVAVTWPLSRLEGALAAAESAGGRMLLDLQG